MAYLPEIKVYFTQQANSFAERSERGNVILIIRDSASAKVNGKMYTSLTDFKADASTYAVANQIAIKDALGFSPYAVYIIAIGTDDTVDKALTQIPGIVKTGWITVAGITSADATAIASWISTEDAAGKSYKAVVYNSAANSKRIVNFTNTAVVWKDGRTAAASTYTPSLAAIFAACNVKRGATNFACTNLTSVTEPASAKSAVESGQLVLINDEDGVVRIASAVNSLTSLGDGDLESEKQIEVVEAMDLMVDDIRSNFRKNFMGKYKNTRGNQMVFVAEMNTYFNGLASNDIISSDFTCELDIDAQRAAWDAAGKDTSAWTDYQLKDHPFKRSMFVAASCMILESIETLDFSITLN